jgi:hypothetical protein
MRDAYNTAEFAATLKIINVLVTKVSVNTTIIVVLTETFVTNS